MNKHISALSLTVISCILIFGFGFETDGIYKFKYSDHSPLDLSVSGVKAEKTDEGKIETTDWYSSAMSEIKKAEYIITFNEEQKEYQSPNRENNMRFIYHKDGFTAKLRNNKIALFDETDRKIEDKDKKYKYSDEWKLKLTAQNVKSERGDNIPVDMNLSEMKAAGNKASIENENLRIEYTNDERGMRQDFIIKKKPEGDGRLRLSIQAETKLKMIIGADALMFKDKNGNDKMKYSALKCWDVNGKELRAYFEKSNYELRITNYELKDRSKIETNSKSEIPISQFSIVVNDEGAVYPVTIDPLSTTLNWSAESNQENSDFGFSVATAGDVNGDGYSDVLIGASLFDNGQTDEGRVFVYHGSALGLLTTANWTAESNQEGSSFGYSVSTAGDVNNDGYSDVIIGAYSFANGQTDEGGAFIYHGSASGLAAGASIILESNQAGANFGIGVSTAGDVDGDGYSDVIIGATKYDNGETDEGMAFVYYGSEIGIQISGFWNAESDQAGAIFGLGVSTAGDVNGDGYSDVIIGAVGFDNGEISEGKVFAFLGSLSGLSDSANWTAEGNQASSRFGSAVSTAGDVNGDGYSDVLVGAYRYDNGQTDEGGVFIYHGSASGLAANSNWGEESGQAGAFYGYSVSTAGDVNGDGYSDIIVGALNFDNGQLDEGKAYVYFGSASGMSFYPKWSTESNQENASYGISVSTAGDVNGDGFSDVVIGADRYTNGESEEGKVYVYHGFANGLSGYNWTAESNQSGAYLGNSVSTAGDVNGDGFSDVIVAARDYDNALANAGKVFVFHGSASGLSVTANWTAESNQAVSGFGVSVSTAGDLNGDGFSDVIVGASRFDNGQTDEGKVFVYYGSVSGLSATANWTAESNQVNAYFGYCVSTAGDVNGDGYSDVIIGAVYFDNGQTDEGRAFAYYGSATGLSLATNWFAESNQIGGYFGNCVASAGDINGDGFSDVIIGATGFESGQVDEGRVYAFNGSASGLAVSANWIVEGNQTYGEFGNSVSTAGDVNGDGFSDVIVGAYVFNMAFVYFGSASGLNSIPDWTKESNLANASFGYSVSTAGDVNGDGYSDVIIGASTYSTGGTAFVFPGSPSGLSTVSSWTNINGNGRFGASVSSAGDVNGDGYSDVIVGAYQYSNGEFQEGRAFLYYGNSVTGLRSTVQQYEPGTNNIVSSGGLTGTDGQVRLNIFGRSPFGRASGKIVYELKENGVPFSGMIISNSTASSGAGTNTDLGIAGSQLNNDVAGLQSDKEYKWRARVQYSLVNNPYQKFSPWKYYNNYIPTPLGNFRASDGSTIKQLNLTMLMQGFYNSSTDLMVQDTARVYLRNSSSPYAILDSAKAFLSNTGAGTYSFANAVNGVNYYLQLKQRNSLETWSKTTQTFTANTLTYNFTSANTQAFGNNMINVDASPVRYAVYSGDVNNDGTVDLNDVVQTYNAANVFSTGYILTDLTGDNLADLNDVILAYNNSAAFVAAVRP